MSDIGLSDVSVLLIAPVWNRNGLISFEEAPYQRALLIAPVWNRNIPTRQYSQKRVYMPFNRTSLE